MKPISMIIQIYYPKRNFSGFDIPFSGRITEREYDEKGKFLQFHYNIPSIEHYEKVSTVEFQKGTSNEEIFHHIVSSHNIGNHPSTISERIRSGELNTEHSSFSSGDIIQIGGCFYISNGMNFELLPTEFSHSLQPN